MLDNSSTIPGRIEMKLLKLYSEQELLSLKIIELLNLVSITINSGDGVKLEIYSHVEQELINKLLKINIVINSFEKICTIYSSELNRYRAVSLDRQQTIREMEKLNQQNLKYTLLDLSSQIGQFSGKLMYASSFSKQIIPHFINLSV